MFVLNLTVYQKCKENTVGQPKIKLLFLKKKKKFSNSLNKLLSLIYKVITLSLYHSIKMAPELSMCLPYIVHVKIFKHSLILATNLNLESQVKTVGVFFNCMPNIVFHGITSGWGGYGGFQRSEIGASDVVGIFRQSLDYFQRHGKESNPIVTHMAFLQQPSPTRAPVSSSFSQSYLIWALGLVAEM